MRVLLPLSLTACQLIVGTEDPESLILDRIAITGAQLQPSFDPEITDYQATLPYGDTVTIRPHSPDPDTTITIGDVTMVNDSPFNVGLQSGANVVAIVVSTQQGVSKTYRVTLNVPGARLGTPTMKDLSSAPRSIKTADFNLDGTPDIAVCESFSIQIFDPENNLNTFGPAIVGIGKCRDFAIGDLDAQLGPDVVVVNEGSGALVFLNDGSVGFGAPGTTGGAQSLISVGLGHIDNDGDLDLILGDNQFGNPVDGVMRWTLGAGDGTFGGLLGPLAAGANPNSFVVGNVDGNAGDDVVVLDGNGAALTLIHGDGVNNFVFGLGDATNTFNGAVQPTMPRSLIATTADAIPAPDYALLHVDQNELRLIRNFAGKDTVETDLIQTSFELECDARALAAADLDKDGHEDLLVACQTNSTLMVFYGDGEGGYVPMRIAIPGPPTSVAVADFNGDELPDVVVGADPAAMYVLLQEAP